jgi:hypothetical protein
VSAVTAVAVLLLVEFESVAAAYATIVRVPIVAASIVNNTRLIPTFFLFVFFTSA